MNKEEIIRKLFNQRKINNLTGCWVWLGSICSNGYGRIWIGPRNGGQRYLVHRLSAELFLNNFETWLQVNHKCDNKICFNPEHLYSGTQQENVQDKYDRGRANHARGEQHGKSKLTNEDVKFIRRYELCKTRTQIAKELNVSASTVSAVINGKTWAN